jgi:uncharacterized protein
MKNGFLLLQTAISIAIVLWLSGCAQSPQARFYTLTPLAQQEVQTQPASNSPISVNIMPVEIPDYLNRPQIVTRSGQNELQLAEFDRWVSSLPDNIAAVMAENLSQLITSDKVLARSWGRYEKTDYTLVLRVIRLDCIPGVSATMRVQWTLSTPADEVDVATRVSTYSEKLQNARYDTAVVAVSTLLGRVSREIAREIGERRKGK